MELTSCTVQRSWIRRITPKAKCIDQMHNHVTRLRQALQHCKKRFEVPLTFCSSFHQWYNYRVIRLQHRDCYSSYKSFFFSLKYIVHYGLTRVPLRWVLRDSWRYCAQKTTTLLDVLGRCEDVYYWVNVKQILVRIVSTSRPRSTCRVFVSHRDISCFLWNIISVI